MLSGNSRSVLKEAVDILIRVNGDRIASGIVNEKKHRVVRYFPLVEPLDVGPTIGVALDGRWVVGTATNLRFLTDDKPSVGWLILLEHHIDGIRSQIFKSVEDQELTERIAREIPFQVVAVSGLESEMEYWNSLAMDWIEGGVFAENISTLLEKISLDSSKSQRIRHRAKRLFAIYGEAPSKGSAGCFDRQP